MELSKREKFNSLSHGLGAIASFLGLFVLVLLASLKGDPWKIFSFLIYGVSLITLYLVSAMYHGMQGKKKEILQRFDHDAIYLLIAGTYTPISLVTLRGVWGWSIFSLVWFLAFGGIYLDNRARKNEKKSGKKRRRILPIVLYIVMGWVCIIALEPLLEVLPINGFQLLLLGGVLYTGGVLFYALGKIIPQFHGVWHLFVLAGSFSHFMTMLLYVA